jgi:hypothetical protein
VSQGAREALTRAASAFPGGEAMVGQVIQTGRESLSNSIHNGFVFMLFASGLAIIAVLLMKNIRWRLETLRQLYWKIERKETRNLWSPRSLWRIYLAA